MDSQGFVEYTYHGFNYVVGVAGRSFQVRTYDFEPGVATVISPSLVVSRMEAPELVAFLRETLGAEDVKFYHGPTGGYRSVDLESLEFKERE